MRPINLRMLPATLALLLIATALAAQTVPRTALAAELRQGGFVILMRHASSPRQLPDAASANADNTTPERQLDAAGRRDAGAMGAALKRLGLPVGEVLSSPTYRALETARLIDAGKARAVEQLGNEGMAASDEVRTNWLQSEVTRKAEGGNRLLITHGPNISAAFAQHAGGMTEGEALIFDPRGANGPMMIQRIRIEEWADL
jgi:phosphohistidine phosphatase SixA